jgi:hypothetical protein
MVISCRGDGAFMVYSAVFLSAATARLRIMYAVYSAVFERGDVAFMYAGFQLLLSSCSSAPQ